MAMLWGSGASTRFRLQARTIQVAKLSTPVSETEEKQLQQRFGTRLFDAKLEQMMGGPIARAILLGSEVVYQGGTSWMP